MVLDSNFAIYDINNYIKKCIADFFQFIIHNLLERYLLVHVHSLKVKGKILGNQLLDGEDSHIDLTFTPVTYLISWEDPIATSTYHIID